MKIKNHKPSCVNNNMNSNEGNELDYGHFYDLEKDDYLDQYKHFKKFIIKKREEIIPALQPDTKKSDYVYGINDVIPYVFVSIMTFTLTMYYFY